MCPQNGTHLKWEGNFLERPPGGGDKRFILPKTLLPLPEVACVAKYLGRTMKLLGIDFMRLVV